LAAPLEYPPGSGTEYSNAGFSLLAAIVETVAKRPYRDFIREQLLRPAGLTHTGFQSDAERWNTDLMEKGFDGMVETPRRDDVEWGYLGAAGILTSVTDLHKWEIALTGEKILNQ